MRLCIIVLFSLILAHESFAEESYDDLIKDIFTSSTNAPIQNKQQGQTLDDLINDLDKSKNNQDTLSQPKVRTKY